MRRRQTISSTLAAAVIVASASLAWAQSSGSSGGTGGTGGAGAAGGTGGGAGATGAGTAGTGGSAAPTPGTSIPSGTGPAPAPTPGQSFSFPSNVGTPGTNDPSGNRIPSGTGPAPGPTPGQSSTLPSAPGTNRTAPPSGSALDTTGMAGSRPGCTPTTSGSADATGNMRTPRIANDPALGSGPTAETGGAGGNASVDTGVGGNTSLPRSSAAGRNDC